MRKSLFGVIEIMPHLRVLVGIIRTSFSGHPGGTMLVAQMTRDVVRRIAVAAGGVIVMCGAGAVRASAPATRPAAASDANWPAWRGPLASGFAPLADPPTTWAEDKNVRWKVKIPGRGTASPVVWGESIFIQTAIPGEGAEASAAPPAGGARGGRRSMRGGGGGFGVAKPSGPYKFVILCLDRKTGQTRWEKVAKEETPHEWHHPDHGYSSYSPVTDGNLLFAYFGSRGLHCYDMQGNLKWSKDLGHMQTRNGFGEGSSPALYDDTIVINWDQDGGGEDFIAAFDKNTGEQRWRTPRDEDHSWSTPLVVQHDGQAQVVTTATGKVRGYDFKTGKELWNSPGLTANTIPSPVASDGMVFATAGFRGSALYAIKLGATGDLTGTDSIAWTGQRGTPYVPSPLLYGNRLYLFSGNNGVLSCFDTKTGKPIVEQQRIDDLEGVYASPVGAAGRVYLVGRNGATVVIKHLDQSDKVEVIATNELKGRFDASPALVGKELFLRGQGNLYCISEDK
jgi:outer membrane protein assembly factor BamB